MVVGGGGWYAYRQTTTQINSVGWWGMMASAEKWLDRGCSLVPLQPNSKHVIAGFGAYGDQVIDVICSRFWFSDRRCNIGLVTGAGVVVLDFDDVASYAWWAGEAGEQARTYTERTRRGFHVFFSGHGGSGRVGGVEVLGHGRVVVVAPSVVVGFEYHPLIVDGADLLELPPKFSLLSEKPVINPLPLSKENSGDDTVARIKRAFSILDVAREVGVTGLYSRDGRWYHGLCPFHSDNEASFWVDTQRGTWGCFACHYTGDVINLWARGHGLGVGDAIKAMAQEL